MNFVWIFTPSLLYEQLSAAQWPTWLCHNRNVCARRGIIRCYNTVVIVLTGASRATREMRALDLSPNLCTHIPTTDSSLEQTDLLQPNWVIPFHEHGRDLVFLVCRYVKLGAVARDTTFDDFLQREWEGWAHRMFRCPTMSLGPSHVPGPICVAKEGDPHARDHSKNGTVPKLLTLPMRATTNTGSHPRRFHHLGLSFLVIPYYFMWPTLFEPAQQAHFPSSLKVP